MTVLCLICHNWISNDEPEFLPDNSRIVEICYDSRKDKLILIFLPLNSISMSSSVFDIPINNISGQIRVLCL